MEKVKLEGIVDIIGKEKFAEICRVYGGTCVYIPMHKSTVREDRNKEIIRRFDGFNFEQLASEYRMSVTHLRRILRAGGVI